VGYPDRDTTGPLLDALVDAGADIIELGVPFSDPVADGPTIQRSSQRALENGVTLPWVLEVLTSFRRRRDTPVVLFTYLSSRHNPRSEFQHAPNPIQE
jgi:tryptophan synthase alpha chain